MYFFGSIYGLIGIENRMHPRYYLSGPISGCYCMRPFIIYACSMSISLLNRIKAVSDKNERLISTYEPNDCSDSLSRVATAPALKAVNDS